MKPLKKKKVKKFLEEYPRDNGYAVMCFEWKEPNIVERAVILRQKNKKLVIAVNNGFMKRTVFWKEYNRIWRVWKKEPKYAEMKAAEWED